MVGIIELEVLLRHINPILSEEEFVFCFIEKGKYGDLSMLNPIGSFLESEGMTLILEKSLAKSHELYFEGVFRKITLQVHSSLEAVGLTAKVASALSKKGISANVIAAYYHDHIFVPTDRSKEALEVLLLLSRGKT